MNNICYAQASSTFSSVLMAGLLAMQMSDAIPTRNVTEQRSKPLLQSAYSVDGNQATFNSYSNPITGAYDFTPSGFEQAVGDFYSRLLARQEPLGAAFEKVLYDNLWDLYES